MKYELPSGHAAINPSGALIVSGNVEDALREALELLAVTREHVADLTRSEAAGRSLLNTTAN